MPKLVTAKCQRCGKESQVEWTLGAKCPNCGADKFFPVIYVGKEEMGEKKKKTKRLSQSPVAAGIVALLVIGAVTALIVSAWSTLKEKKYYTTITMVCTNPKCGELFREKMATRDAFVPQVTCRRCGKKTAFRAVACRNCGTIFALEPGGWPKVNPTHDLKCPACKSEDINMESHSIPPEKEKAAE